MVACANLKEKLRGGDFSILFTYSFTGNHNQLTQNSDIKKVKK